MGSINNYATTNEPECFQENGACYLALVRVSAMIGGLGSVRQVVGVDVCEETNAPPGTRGDILFVYV